MKVLSIYDFMKDKEEYRWHDDSFSILNNNGKLRLVVNGKSCDVENQDDLQGMIEEWCDGLQIRFCECCGCPMDRGYTDDYADFYTCENCFPVDMDERYGEGNWRPMDSEEPNFMGGFYEYFDRQTREWEAEPSYYTEWN